MQCRLGSGSPQKMSPSSRPVQPPVPLRGRCPVGWQGAAGLPRLPPSLQPTPRATCGTMIPCVEAVRTLSAAGCLRRSVQLQSRTLCPNAASGFSGPFCSPRMPSLLCSISLSPLVTRGSGACPVGTDLPAARPWLEPPGCCLAPAGRWERPLWAAPGACPPRLHDAALFLLLPQLFQSNWP